MTAAVDMLRRLLAHVTDDRPLDPEAASWFAAGAQAYLADAARGLRLDDALDLRPPSYTTPWWKPATADRRRELMLRLAKHFRQADPTNTARAIACAADRYAATEWKRSDHALDGCPAEYAGDPRGVFFELHHGPYRWPLAWRRIRDLIAE